MSTDFNMEGRTKVAPADSITGALGGSCPVLPGESELHYKRGLSETIQELGAETPLQVYLAEKIYDTLVWMRRYEAQKRALLFREMARTVGGCRLLQQGEVVRDGGLTEKESVAIEAMFANEFDDEGLEYLAADANHTVESLRQQAFQARRGALQEIDSQIALLAKSLASFQASFEVLVNRRRNIERLELQNSLMRRDLAAIVLQDTKSDESRKKKR